MPDSKSIATTTRRVPESSKDGLETAIDINANKPRKRMRYYLVLALVIILVIAVLAAIFSGFAYAEAKKEEAEKMENAAMEQQKRNNLPLPKTTTKPEETTEPPLEPLTCQMLTECSSTRIGTPPPLLIISADGFAKSYLNKEDTPTILKMGECGGRAEALIPSFPSKSLPNHFTIATGLYPANHGVVDNRFTRKEGEMFNQDNGSHYHGEPIWNTVVNAGKKSNVMMWLGSFDKINGVEATVHESTYNKTKYGKRQKIEKAINWLVSDSPPDLAMLYIEDPDEAGHVSGPGTEQVRKDTVIVDGYIRYIFEKLRKAGLLGCTNIIVLSDHGMRNITKRTSLESIDPSLASIKSTTGNNVMFHEAMPYETLEKLKHKHGNDYRVYRTKDEVPLRYHFNTDHIGFPYINGNPGNLSYEQIANAKKNDTGNHGWDNLDKQMETIFFAVGPSIKENVVIPPFQNVELYNFFADLLGVRPAENDGTAGLLDGLLRKPPLRQSSYVSNDHPECDPQYPISASYTLRMADTSICVFNEKDRFATGHVNLDYGISLKNKNGKMMAFETLGKCLRNEVDEVVKFAEEMFQSKIFTQFYISMTLRKLLPDNRHQVRQQFGQFSGSESAEFIFFAAFWCVSKDQKVDWKDDCESEEATRTEAYVLPINALEDPFNALTSEDFLFDYRVSFADIEKAAKLSLLPKSMELAKRRRISLRITKSKFDD